MTPSRSNDTGIRRRTTEERKAYIEGYRAALANVLRAIERAVAEQRTHCELIAQDEIVGD